MSDRREFLLQTAATTVAAASALKLTPCAATESLSAGMTKTYRIPNTNLTVSCIAYGCGALAAWDHKPVDSDERSRADGLIHTAYEHGINFFDHADLYAFGKSESVFGEVLKASPGLRQKIVIQSKCGQVFPPGWSDGKPIRVYLTREHIVTAAEGSLKRLNTDYLDILLLHAPSALVRPDEVADAFDILNRSGKVRYFGVSNHTAAQIQLLKKAVKQPIVANQIHLGLGHPDALTDGIEVTAALAQAAAAIEGFMSISGAGTIDYCRLQDIQIQAWSPLRGGLLNPTADSSPQIKDVAQKLGEFATTKRTNPAAVALAWLLHHPASIVPITGPVNPRHIIENCAAESVILSDDEWYDLLAAATDLKSRLPRGA